MFIAQNKNSNYYILLPENASEQERFAGEEIQKFVEEASGAELVLSTTPIAEKKTIKLCVEKAQGDAFHIRTDDEYNYTIIGNNIHCVVYGSYAFLRKIIALEFFAPTAYTLTKGDIACQKIEFESVADIPVRTAGMNPVHSEIRGTAFLPNCLRMGLRGMAEGWALFTHTHFKILPPAIYKEAHPDWYASNVNQLCWTNEEMRAEFVKRVQEIILANPDQERFMLGQEDGSKGRMCECPRCKKRVEELGGSKSAVGIEFVNEAVKSLNEWIKDNVKDRNIEFSTFAYSSTFLPPVYKENGEFKPIKDFAIEDNLSIMIAPFGARGDLSYFDKRNELSTGCCYHSPENYKTKDIFDGWSKVFKKMCVWSYSINYGDGLAPFNSFYSFEKNYREFKKLGVNYLFEQGNHTKYTPNFNALRLYLCANLSWDTTLSTNTLIKRFFNGYFGKASKPMRKYFNQLMRKCKRSKRPMTFARFDDYSDFTAPEYWSMQELLRLEQMVLNASKLVDGAEKERVEEECMPIWYMLLLHYGYSLPVEKRKAVWDKFMRVAEKYGHDGTGTSDGSIDPKLVIKIKNTRF